MSNLQLAMLIELLIFYGRQEATSSNQSVKVMACLEFISERLVEAEKFRLEREKLTEIPF